MVILTNDKTHPNYAGRHLRKDSREKLEQAGIVDNSLELTGVSSSTEPFGHVPSLVPPAVVLKTDEGDNKSDSLYDGQGDTVVDDESVGFLPVPKPVMLADIKQDEEAEKKKASETDDVGPIPRSVMLAK